MGLFDHSEEPRQLHIDETTKAYLLEAARWAKFVAIFGLIIFGMLLLVGAAIMFGQSAIAAQSGMSAATLGIIYIVMSLLYFYPLWALLKFAAKIKNALIAEDQEVLNSSFRFLKNHFKSIGIIIVGMIIIYALVILFAVVVGGVAAL